MLSDLYKTLLYVCLFLGAITLLVMFEAVAIGREFGIRSPIVMYRASK